MVNRHHVKTGTGAWQAGKGTNLLILTTGSGFSAVCGGFLHLAGLMQKAVRFEGLATGLGWILDQQADRNHRSPNGHKFYPLYNRLLGPRTVRMN